MRRKLLTLLFIATEHITLEHRGTWKTQGRAKSDELPHLMEVGGSFVPATKEKNI